MIPQDGTFDQEAPVRSLLSQNRDCKDRFIGSADMSAATDRLPALLQAHLLSHVLGRKIGMAWLSLLTDRPYQHKLIDYVYAVGQPMGALSSWAALAITHHFMWQLSAWRSGIVPFGV